MRAQHSTCITQAGVKEYEFSWDMLQDSKEESDATVLHNKRDLDVDTLERGVARTRCFASGRDG